MSFVKNGISAIGKLLMVTALVGTFLVGMISVVYLSLKGEQVEIPKVVGKNVNEGEDELASLGLRLKKIAYRYSTEKPNTILEQRPRAGETAKTGLLVSVIVSQANPDGNEAPINVEDKEKEVKKEADEIKELPELETDKSKKKAKKSDKKETTKTRDIVKDKKTTEEKTDKDNSKEAETKDKSKSDTETKSDGKEDKAKTEKSASPPTSKPANNAKPETNNTPKGAGDTRNRRVPPSN